MQHKVGCALHKTVRALYDADSLQHKAGRLRSDKESFKHVSEEKLCVADVTFFDAVRTLPDSERELTDAVTSFSDADFILSDTVRVIFDAETKLSDTNPAFTDAEGVLFDTESELFDEVNMAWPII